MSTPSPNNRIDPEVLSLLVCPVTRSPLRQDGDFLVGETGGLAYPIRDGLPVLLAEEARLPSGVSSLDAFKEKFVR